MLIIVDTASGDIRREPASGLKADIMGDCVWALGVVLQWMGDGTEQRRSVGLGFLRGSLTSSTTARINYIKSPTSCAHPWQCT
jgi:hypothetical protein